MSARLYYELYGPTDAPVLVMGGSIGTTTSMWERQLPALTRHFRVLRYDHRGHGRSEVPIGPYTVPDLGGDVLALLDEAGLDLVHYCGLSLGGMVGLWLAAHAPDRIDRLAVACTSPYVGAARTRYAERAVVVRDRGMASIAELAVSRWFTPEFAEREPDTVARVTKELAAVPAEGYASCCEALSTVALRP